MSRLNKLRIKAIENQYDKIALQYHIETEKDLFKNNKEKLQTETIDRTHIIDTSDWHILDLGCGSGIHAKYFIERHPETKCIYGIDASEKMIKIARKHNYSDKIKYLIGEMDSLPFANNYFDFIFSRNSIHYSFNLNRTFAEIFRVLKKEGKIFFKIPILFIIFFAKRTKTI